MNLDKLASPKWIKQFLQLSPEAQKRIVAARLKERTIKGLGEGASRISDLVVHPEHGLAVRKLPYLRSVGNPNELKRSFLKNKKQISAEKHLRSVAKNEGDFAHIIAGDPSKAYYQAAFGGQHEVVGRIGDIIKREKELISDIKKLEKKYPRYGFIDQQPPKIRERLTALENELHGIRVEGHGLMPEVHGEQKLSPAGEKIWDKFKSRYPGAYDRRHHNMVGGKLVDFEPGDADFDIGAMFPQKMPNPNEVRKYMLGGGYKSDLGTDTLEYVGEHAVPSLNPAKAMSAGEPQGLVGRLKKHKDQKRRAANINLAKNIGLGTAATLGVGGLGALGYNALTDKEPEQEQEIEKAANMTTQQAYINGFVKRAAQYGYNHYEAMNILKAAEAEGVQPQQPGFLAQGLQRVYNAGKGLVNDAGDAAGNLYNSGKELLHSAGDAVNRYAESKNTPTQEDLAANVRARSAYAQQMAPQPQHQKLPGTLAGGTLSGGTAATVQPIGVPRGVPPKPITPMAR